MATKKKAVSKETKVPVKGLFDHLKAIFEVQSIDYFKTLSDGDKKTFSTYMVNRFISMDDNYIPFVNEYQMYGLQNEHKTTYLFYSQMLPRGRHFRPYVKARDTVKYEDWLVDLVRKHFEISSKEAIEYIKLYFHTDKTALRSLCEKFGVDPKLLKKSGL